MHYVRAAIGRRLGLPRSVLIVDHQPPQPDRDAGSVVVDGWMRTLLGLGCNVTFLSAKRSAVGLLRVAALGIACPQPGEGESDDALIERTLASVEAVVVCRFGCARPIYRILDRVGALHARIFLPIDLHFLRHARESALSAASPDTAAVKSAELAVARASDVICVHSSYEQTLLAEACPEVPAVVIPIIQCAAEPARTFAQRRGVCFVGGFAHRPNIDGIVSFAREVWPLVQAKLPGETLTIIGGDAPEAVQNLARDDTTIRVAGHVPDLAGVLDGVRATVAPLRYGAGVKGKVVSSLCRGVPVVGTPIAFEGMDLELGEEVLVGESPAELAAGVVALCTDRSLWEKLSRNGFAHARREYAPRANIKKIAQTVRIGARRAAQRRRR